MSIDTPSTFRHRTHHGGVYIAVLGVSLLVMTIGLGGLLAVRAQAGTADDLRNTLRAQAASTAAVELARLFIHSNANWRSILTSGTWSAATTFAGGQIRWRVTDTSDANLADDASEPVTIEGMAELAGCTRLTSVDLQVHKNPLDALKSTLHAAGAMENNGILTSAGRGISTSATLTNKGNILGDAAALLVLGSGSISGTTTILNIAPAMPQDSVFDSYKARATTIAWGGGAGDWTLSWPLLSAAVNPSGSRTNADGIYAITIPANRVLYIEAYRIRGTLVIECEQKACVQLTKAISWEPHRTDLPTLLIRHATAIYAQDTLSPAIGMLSESALGVNLNPPDSPYEGVTNSTLTDSYPSRLCGLVHLIFPPASLGSTTVQIGNGASFRGTILCTGSVAIDASGASLTFDESLFADPPDGYYTGSMQIIPSTWKRVAAP